MRRFTSANLLLPDLKPPKVALFICYGAKPGVSVLKSQSAGEGKGDYDGHIDGKDLKGSDGLCIRSKSAGFRIRITGNVLLP